MTWERKRREGKRIKRTRIFHGTMKEARRFRAKQIAKAHGNIEMGVRLLGAPAAEARKVFSHLVETAAVVEA